MPRQFQGSLGPLQDLETKAARPAKNSVFSGGENTPASQGPAPKRRATDRAPKYEIESGVYIGAGIGSLVWIAALWVWAVIA